MSNTQTEPTIVEEVKDQLVLTGERIEEGQIDTLDTPVRWLGLLGRVKPALTASARYLAYTR